ncbi:MAG: alpha/beta fold hydrolase [Proteobacteria bacterium]|nr:alpha/beta fold hydrolase [Pseudomonadota bacterium]
MNELDYQTYSLGEVELESGETLGDARLAYQTFGSLNAAKNNAVLLLTHFGGTHAHSAHFMAPGRALDPNIHFIVIVNLIGNGVSSSPSNSGGANFPQVSMADNVRLQKRLLEENLGVTKLALVVGHSMGAAQAYHWAALFPEYVERAAPICGSAKTSTHNDVFLEGMRGILTADPVWANGNYSEQPVDGLRVMSRAWAAWPPSAHFYRNAHYKTLGFSSAEDFLTRYWEATYTAMDANNVLTQIATWRSSDISNNELYNGDFKRALGAITARLVLMPCLTDAYFPPEDSEIEMRYLDNAVLRPIDSEWGHWAGSGRNKPDSDFIDAQLKELLAT